MTECTVYSDLQKSGNNGMLSISAGNILSVKDMFGQTQNILGLCGDTDNTDQKAEK